MASRWRCPPDKFVAAFTEQRVVAVWQFHDEFVGRGDLGGAFDLLAAGVRMTERDVGRDGVAEKETFLEDEADVAAQIVEIELPDVHFVDQRPGRGPGS